VLKVRADTKEAERSLKQLERQVNKLGDLADQGEKLQNGFLSPAQVHMYRNITKEIEKTYQQHFVKLSSLHSNYRQRTRNANDELTKRQQNLSYAQGNNKWGNVASPRIMEYHQRKFDEANAKVADLTAEGAEIQNLRARVRELNAERKRVQPHVENIDSMHQMDKNTKYQINSLASNIGTMGGILSAAFIGKYILGGMNPIEMREREADVVAQKGGHGGTSRERIRDIDNLNAENKLGYSANETNRVTSYLATTGLSQDRSKLLADTNATERFARAYGLQDPTMLTEGYGTMRKMGALEDGDMKKFADLIGGSIKRNSMSGREEEQTRAMTALLHNVSSSLTSDQMNQKTMGNVVSLGTMLGQVDPSMKGEKGAQLLSGVDGAIKGANSNMDILLGKGTKYTGIEGQYDLQLMKEKGISDPENLKTLLTNIDQNVMGNDKLKQLTLFNFLKEGGADVSLSQVQKIWTSGMKEKLQRGEYVDPESIAKLGEQDQDKSVDKWMDTKTNKRDVTNSLAEQQQRKDAEIPKDSWDNIKSWWQSMPDQLQTGLAYTGMVGAGVGGAMLTGALKKRLFQGAKDVTKDIGGRPGPLHPSTLMGRLKGMFGKGGPPAPPVTPVTPVTPPVTPTVAPTQAARLPGMAYDKFGKPILDLDDTHMTKGAYRAQKFGDFMFDKVPWKGLAAGAGISVAGSMIESRIDTIAPAKERSEGMKRVSSLTTDPNQLVDGKKLDGMGYFDYLKGSVKDVSNTITSSEFWSGLKTVAFGSKEEIAQWKEEQKKVAEAKKLAAPETSYQFLKDNKANQERYDMPKEQVIKITIDGKIQGMNSSNETQIKEAVVEHFKLKGLSPTPPVYNFNPAVAQQRR
jgi:hypothetical protein